MLDELEDFDSPDETEQDPVGRLLNEAEGIEFRGASLVLSDAAMVAAQSLGLKLFNLSEDKLSDSDNVYDGQLADAIVTIFCSMCEAGDIPDDTPNAKKWQKILKRRTLGAMTLKPYKFEEIIADFANDFKVTDNLAETFAVFDQLWGHVFKADVTLKGESDAEAPGKSQSPQPSEQPSPASTSESITTQPDTAFRPQSSALRSL